MLKIFQSPISVAISLGGGADLAITKDDRLVIQDYSNQRIDLGKVTRRRIEALQDYLERMKIHAVE